jgi:exopolysaccharide biosynthesis polyprenyl glycosylphosphotransferase
MATQDYLQQGVVSGRPRPVSAGATGGRVGFLRRPSVTSLIWACMDFATIGLAATLALLLRADDLVGASGGTHDVLAMLPLIPRVDYLYLLWFALCLVFFARTYGLYAPIQHTSGLHEQRMTVQATLTAGLILCGTLFLSHETALSRIIVLLMIAFTMVLLCGRRLVWRRMVYARFREGVETRNVLIVGAGRVAHALRNHLESLRHLGYRFKGFIALTEREAESGNADIVGDVRNTLSLARSLFVDEIFVSVPTDKKLIISLVEEARAVGIDVRVVPDMYDGLAWNATVEYIGQFPTIPLHRRDFPIDAYIMKRVLDVSVSVILMLLLAPVMLAIIILVKLDSPGPAFYGAQRIGRKGRSFRCWKFRTMVPNADSLKEELEHLNERKGVLFKITDDPRVTRVGRRLRKYSLDELPQFYNVLRGDMSLVGPRPPIASEVEKYDLSHLRRLDVLPGITGLWQVEARQDPSFDSYISLDTAYVENWTVFLDIKILLRTIGVVLTGTGT